MRVAAPIAALALCLACAPSDGGAPSVDLEIVALPADSDAVPESVGIDLQQPGGEPAHVALALDDGQWRGRVAIAGGLPALLTASGLDGSGAIVGTATANPATTPGADGPGLLVVGLNKPEPNPSSNKPPVIVWLAASSTQVTPGSAVQVEGFALDPNLVDNLSLKYAWTATAGTFDKPSSAATTWRAPSGEVDARLTLTVTDRWGAKASASFTICVRYKRGNAYVRVSVNAWPTVTSVQSSSATADLGQPVPLRATGFDPEGDPLAWSWTAACAGRFTGTGATVTFTPRAPYPPGNACAVTTHVRDGRGGSNEGTLVIRVAPPTRP